MGLKLHNARRSYELRYLFLKLQNNRSLRAREVHFLSSVVTTGRRSLRISSLRFLESEKKFPGHLYFRYFCKRFVDGQKHVNLGRILVDQIVRKICVLYRMVYGVVLFWVCVSK